MTLKKLLEFINLENQRILKHYGSPTKSEEILARTVKLGEEFGELCNEVMSFNGDQRKEKMDNYDKTNLPNEFADVVITTLLLAKSMDVDIKEALSKKIDKINKRYK